MGPYYLEHLLYFYQSIFAEGKADHICREQQEKRKTTISSYPTMLDSGPLSFILLKKPITTNVIC